MVEINIIVDVEWKKNIMAVKMVGDQIITLKFLAE